ncbi:MAG: PadR family transcriptional regulator [Acidobacteriota bacterium]
MSENPAPAKTPLKLVKGTVDVMILKALSRGAHHGYGVSQWLRERSEGELELEDAALYQALHRLEGKDLIASEWGLSENNRRAKFYRLTGAGRAALARETAFYRRYVEVVLRVLDARAGG